MTLPKLCELIQEIFESFDHARDKNTRYICIMITIYCYRVSVKTRKKWKSNKMIIILNCLVLSVLKIIPHGENHITWKLREVTKSSKLISKLTYCKQFSHQINIIISWSKGELRSKHFLMTKLIIFPILINFYWDRSFLVIWWGKCLLIRQWSSSQQWLISFINC